VSYNRKIKRGQRYVKPKIQVIIPPPIIAAGSLIYNLYPKVRGKGKKHVRPSRIQVLAPPIVLAGGLIWNLRPKLVNREEKHVKPKIQVIIPPPVIGRLIWNLYPKLGKIRPKRVYTKAGKPQVLAPPIAIPGSIVYTLYPRPRVYDKKDRRKGYAYRGRVIIPIHSGSAGPIIVELTGSPFTPSDAVDGAAFSAAEIIGSVYTDIDEVI